VFACASIRIKSSAREGTVRRFTRWLAAATVFCLPGPLLAAGGGKTPHVDDPQRPRVYVFTSDVGDPDDVRERQRSVQDLRSSLAGNSKHLVLSDDRDRSDVTVAVVERMIGHPKAGLRLFPPSVHGPTSVVRLRVRLTRGVESVELAPARWRLESDHGWASAAADSAKLIAKWIVDHPVR
jgi:hypothetical protein